MAENFSLKVAYPSLPRPPRTLTSECCSLIEISWERSTLSTHQVWRSGVPHNVLRWRTRSRSAPTNMVATCPTWLLSIRNVTSVIGKLNFKLYFIVIKLNSHMWLMAPAWDDTSLEPGHRPHRSGPSVLNRFDLLPAFLPVSCLCLSHWLFLRLLSRAFWLESSKERNPVHLKHSRNRGRREVSLRKWDI